ncbi:hypothetical protein [Catenulispora sp. GAS73]|uniref:hypothetical protein n=1 Tax=Catenulispora sp. GAS73 TaxID=3156269 RepID=UPI00351522DD
MEVELAFASGDEELAGGLGSHAGQGVQLRRGGGDKRTRFGVGLRDLSGELLLVPYQATLALVTI